MIVRIAIVIRAIKMKTLLHLLFSDIINGNNYNMNVDI